jgi:hypothetical protein
MKKEEPSSMLKPFALLLVGYAIGIVVHEAGYAILGSAVGFPIRLVSIGYGPVFWKGRLGETQVELHGVLLGGLTHLFPILFLRRGRLIVFYLGGVVGNALFIAAMVVLDAAGAWPAIVHRNVGPLILSQMYIILSTLAPYRWKGQASDGLLILRQWRRPSNATTPMGVRYAQWRAVYRRGAVDDFAPAPASSRMCYYLELSQQAIGINGRRAILEALLRELARGGLPPDEEAMALDGLVTLGLASGDPQFRSGLEQWSLRALELCPEVKTLRGSRGAALVAQGRFEEGKVLLSTLVDSCVSFDAFMARLFLALAEDGLGDLAAARRWVAQAYETPGMDFSRPEAAALVRRVEAKIGLTA